MDCPVCGYARSAFDAQCPRCKRLAAQGQSRRVVRPAEQTIIVPELSGYYPEAPRGLNLWAVSLLVFLALTVGVFIGRLTAPQPTPGSALATTVSMSRP